MQAEFQAGRAKKRYVALVEGAFPKETVRAKGWMTRDPSSAVRKKLIFWPDDGTDRDQGAGKWCETTFRGIATGRGMSLVEASPETGRLHQIRATLLSMGHPVVGDKLYGPDETIFLRFIQDKITEADRAALRLEHQALHSSEIVLIHPVRKESIALRAAFPRDWKEFFQENFGIFR
jgi:23S rRNA-/tRNA-specific pseudouridylate synthase